MAKKKLQYYRMFVQKFNRRQSVLNPLSLLGRVFLNLYIYIYIYIYICIYIYIYMYIYIYYDGIRQKYVTKGIRYRYIFDSDRLLRSVSCTIVVLIIFVYARIVACAICE